MGENNLDKFRFSRCINFGARDGVVVGRPTEGYHVHMALVGKEALEEWGEWFELEIGKRGALRGLRGNVTSFAAGTRRAIACSFIYKPLASPLCIGRFGPIYVIFKFRSFNFKAYIYIFL